MPDDEVTLGELARNLRDFKLDMDRRFISVESMIRNAQFVSIDRYNPEQAEQNRRINNLEDTNKWLARMLAATLGGFLLEGLFLVLIARGGV